MMMLISAMMKSCLGFGEGLIFNQETQMTENQLQPGLSRKMNSLAASNGETLRGLKG
jgi:hypothetical protein